MRPTTIVLAVLLILAIGGTGWLYWRRPPAEPPRGPDFVVHAAPSEPVEPLTPALKDRVRQALAERRFADLEALAAQYRTPEVPHFTGGMAKLHEFYNMLTDDKFSSDDQTEIKRRAAAEVHADLDAWYKQDPHSPTATMALAVLWVRSALAARGSGYAYDLTDEQSGGMDKALSEADFFLERVDPKADPEALYRVIGAAALRGLNDREFEDLYQQAIANFPHFYEYYAQHAGYSLERWYGAPGDEKIFLDHLRAPERGSDGFVAYAFAEMRLGSYFGRDEIVQQTGLDLPTTIAAFQALEQRYGLGNGAWNALFYIAIQARQCQPAKIALEQIGDRWDKFVWTEKKYFDDNVTFQHLHGHC